MTLFGMWTWVGPGDHIYYQIPEWKRQFYRCISRPIVKYREYPAWAKVYSVSVGGSSNAGIYCQYCSNLLCVLWKLHTPTKQLQVDVLESPSIDSDMPVKKLFVVADSVSLSDSKAVCTCIHYLLSRWTCLCLLIVALFNVVSATHDSEKPWHSKMLVWLFSAKIMVYQCPVINYCTFVDTRIWHRDSVGNTAEENSSIFSLIWMP